MSQPFTVPFPVCQGGHSAQSLNSITILDRASVTPVSTINGVARGVAGCKETAMQSDQFFTTLKSSERGGSMLRLCCQWPFTPKNLLGMGVTEKMVECSLFVCIL